MPRGEAMKRTALLRRTPLRKGTVRLRRSHLAVSNLERKARLRAQQFGPEAEWMRCLPCATCGARPPSEPSHVKTRAAGGGRQDQIPQCPSCHRLFHGKGASAFDHADLPAKAAEHACRWRVLLPAIRDGFCALFREHWPAAAEFLDKEGGW